MYGVADVDLAYSVDVVVVVGGLIVAPHVHGRL